MSRQILPNERKLLLGEDSDAPCGHLQPVLQYLQASGANIERYYRLPTDWLITVLDVFLNKREIFTTFEVPEFVKWEHAEPHFADGCMLSCEVCRNSLEGRFDVNNPQATMGWLDEMQL